MIKAIALDDEPLPLEILKAYADRIPDRIDLISVFNKVQDTKAFLEKEHVDLIFMDIQMPMLSGIDFYRLFGQKKLLIFTTAFSNYAIEGFELHAVDYLLKPFDFERFEIAIRKAEEIHFARTLTPLDQGSIFVKSDSSLNKIFLHEILYVEGLGDYLKIYREHGKPLVTRMTMKGFYELLNNDFLRIHKSFIVRLDKIQSINPKEVKINGLSLPIGPSFSPISENIFRK